MKADVGGWKSTWAEEGTELKTDSQAPELESCWAEQRCPPAAVLWARASFSIPIECCWNGMGHSHVVKGHVLFREVTVWFSANHTLFTVLLSKHSCHISNVSMFFSSKKKDVNHFWDLLQRCFLIQKQVETAGSRSLLEDIQGTLKLFCIWRSVNAEVFPKA